MDSANYITLMLVDKGYYDYDYSEPKAKKLETTPPRTQTDTQKLVARFGVGTKAKADIEELQRLAMDSEGET